MRIKNKNRIRVIGKLIRIYREEKRHNTQNEYTLLRFCDGICTINTLKRIESGECSRSDEVYDELLAKLKLRFDYFPEVDTAVEMMMEPLYEAIEYFDLEGIGRICDKILNLLERVRNYVYYSELYNIFFDVNRYYLEDKEVASTTSKHYEQILNLLPKKFDVLLKQLIMASALSIAIDNIDEYRKKIRKLNIKDDNHPLLRLYMLQYYAIMEQYLSLKEEIDYLEDKFLEEKNFVRLIDIYNYAFLLFSEIEKKRRIHYLNKINKILENENIPKFKVSEICSSIANTLHMEKNYEEALIYFNKVMKYRDNMHITDIIYMANCQSHLNLLIDIPTLTQDILAKHPLVLQYLYNFYQNYDVEAFVKQKIIMKKIAPLLSDKGLIDITRYELRKTFVNKNNYSYLNMFEEMIENNGEDYN